MQEVASSKALDDLVPCTLPHRGIVKVGLAEGLDGFVLHGMLQESECAALIKATEEVILATDVDMNFLHTWMRVFVTRKSSRLQPPYVIA